MEIEDVDWVRVRAGLAGEARRVVHVAFWQEGAVFRALCEVVIREQDGEILGTVAGMPCMTCARVLSLRARIGGEAAELAAGLSRE